MHASINITHKTIIIIITALLRQYVVPRFTMGLDEFCFWFEIFVTLSCELSRVAQVEKFR